MLVKDAQIIQRRRAERIASTPNSLSHVQRDGPNRDRQSIANETGAAIVQRLDEPLHTLLQYIHELKRLAADGAKDGRNAPLLLAESALRETQRVCAIVEQIGNAIAAPSAFDARVAGVEPIFSPSRSGDATPSGSAIRAIERHLTPRESQVLKLICSGATNKEGAQLLQISPRTVESHRAKIMRKFGARNAADLLRMVMLAAR
ncbi:MULTISPECIES: helix-turn-helix transcriptional regulator [Rhodopseudomonas]|uniref:helix-turn-helix domain-containing protein n=1 Tax=Rhodopseudomonas TaxID=1073 RepID=UPI0006972369|nr:MULTISPECIES: helix-turn-helix transcriptional regulator [Rhodopseudomonas]MDF3809441.1 helix-turn-helix transcriptional regulator [Rhodopseudomonas sp. BAL398]WOK15485.1 helix-turn-helix transcriptional regulator [Rhodopseudomonas sp. BAL398]